MKSFDFDLVLAIFAFSVLFYEIITPGYQVRPGWRATYEEHMNFKPTILTYIFLAIIVYFIIKK